MATLKKARKTEFENVTCTAIEDVIDTETGEVRSQRIDLATGDTVFAPKYWEPDFDVDTDTHVNVGWRAGKFYMELA